MPDYASTVVLPMKVTTGNAAEAANAANDITACSDGPTASFIVVSSCTGYASFTSSAEYVECCMPSYYDSPSMDQRRDLVFAAAASHGHAVNHDSGFPLVG